MIEGKYNLGLDIGITGIGWCVTDTDGRILRKGKHHLFGTSLFDEAKTARERRLNRSARRRNDRKKYRIDLLQQLMAPDVLKKDSSFYIRLDETVFRAEDRKKEHLYKTLPEYLFDDGTVLVRQDGCGRKYLPIYEIRSHLIREKKKADIRYVYLAVSHIMKSRGHFLDQTAFGTVKTQEDAVRSLQNVIGVLNDRFCGKISADALAIRNFCLILETEEEPEKVKEATSMILADGQKTNLLDALTGILCGKEVPAKELIPEAKGQISFSMMEDLSVFDDLREEDEELLQTLGEVCAWREARMADRGGKYLSEEMTGRYAKHKEDLSLLKKWMKAYTDTDTYRKMFHDDTEDCNYNAYTHSRTNPGAYEGGSWHWCSQEKLYEKIREMIRSCDSADGREAGKEILSRMYDSFGVPVPNGFLPLQRIRFNAAESNRRQMRDLMAILDNQGEYYLSIQMNKAKIADLCGFVIPSYVGPLRQSDQSPFNPWIRYREKGSGRIAPWDFEKRVDLEATAEAYLEGLTNHCTFLPQEKVLPRHSLLYEEYMVLDELNRIRVQYVEEEEKKGKKRVVVRNKLIPVTLKKRIMDEVFAKYRHVTGDLILRWLEKNSDFSGRDGLAVTSANGTVKRRFTAALSSRIAMEKIFGRRITEEDSIYQDLEQIILWSTVYKDREMYRRRLHREFDGKLPAEALRQLEGFRSEGWGRFSRKLLTAEVSEFREGKKSIIFVMRETNDNFMRVYHNRKYKTKEELNKLLPKDETGKISYNTVLALPCSPAMKRGIWHAVRVLDEIRGYMGSDPKGIYIRNLRDSNARRRTVVTKVRTRFEQVRKLYDAYEEETGKRIDPALRSLLQKTRNGMTDEEYLYLTQLGRCMYTGKPIDLGKPGSFITDYVIPLCLMADDSLDNRVLILAEANQRESKEAMPKSVIRAMGPFWAELNTHGFITGSKRKKLTTAEYDETQLHVYLNSQWKETSLVILKLTELLKQHYRESHVYGINARLTEQLRNKSRLYGIRELNDSQMAYDAFLTAHIGGFADRYLPKVTSEESYTRILLRLWQKTGKGDKNGMILSAYDQDQADEGLPGCPWKNAEERRKYLEKVYSWHDGYVSFLPTEFHGKFYRETLYRPCNGSGIDRKDGLDAGQYGGHAIASTAHMAVISYVRKGKPAKELVNIPVYAAAREDQDYTLKILRERQGFSEEAGYSDLKILRDGIGLNQEIIYDGHPYYMKSATEAVNALQLYVPLKYIRALHLAMTISPEDLENMAEQKTVPKEIFMEAVSFLARKLITQFAVYPKLVKSVREAEGKLAGLRISDQARLIRALLMSMNTKGFRIAPVLKTMSEKIIQGDTRIFNKRIAGEEFVLVNRSVTGIYSKIMRI